MLLDLSSEARNAEYPAPAARESLGSTVALPDPEAVAVASLDQFRHRRPAAVIRRAAIGSQAMPVPALVAVAFLVALLSLKGLADQLGLIGPSGAALSGCPCRWEALPAMPSAGRGFDRSPVTLHRPWRSERVRVPSLDGPVGRIVDGGPDLSTQGSRMRATHRVTS